MESLSIKKNFEITYFMTTESGNQKRISESAFLYVRIEECEDLEIEIDGKMEFIGRKDSSFRLQRAKELSGA